MFVPNCPTLFKTTQLRKTNLPETNNDLLTACMSFSSELVVSGVITKKRHHKN